MRVRNLVQLCERIEKVCNISDAPKDFLWDSKVKDKYRSKVIALLTTMLEKQDVLDSFIEDIVQLRTTKQDLLDCPVTIESENAECA